MKRSVELLKSEAFLNRPLQLFVNRCFENFIMPFHTHDFVEYSYVAEGSGFHHIGEDIVPVNKGMLFVIPIGIPHVFRPVSTDATKTPLVIYNCLFNAELIQSLRHILRDEDIMQHLMDLEQNRQKYISVTDHTGRLEELMHQLYREFSVPGPGSLAMLDTLVSQLIIMTYRQDQQKKCMNSTPHPPMFHDMEAILHYLRQHLGERILMSDLVQLSRWSEKKIGRMFVRYTGQTFRSYVQHLRIQRSCELLKRSDHKVGMIAEMVGYQDMDSFHVAFKKITGVSPLTYRKKSRV
ncbi:AraC family transcriptional regulator [Paenibacillus cucumis (ex Kampfer et al. 2016)]|uniref:Helix-turn-helix transcriptional regulator n=1 Tax=Paenibacillus cucumis (ex Kampfer et al. 2016) TaxID=1776858 RepID=A0ABS7KHD3_9BACL|nr:AraC family transcriptional regulator [Paenibacillus cucumis (ex Kampfer et al. 2016)]MBY0203511.1 helix-turn-helix transcriptional regulator [Paenibacillus cucumis (ex Kampfer et al. 2016)]